MVLNPKQIIYLAISKYLSTEKKDSLIKELSKFDKLSDMKFIKIIETYFDFNLLKNKPKIPQDIWIYNYLMYENRKKDNQNIFDIGEKIEFKGKLLKKGLIVKYEKEITLPQLKNEKEKNVFF